jgi:hypothetical protein
MKPTEDKLLDKKPKRTGNLHHHLHSSRLRTTSRSSSEQSLPLNLDSLTVSYARSINRTLSWNGIVFHTLISVGAIELAATAAAISRSRILYCLRPRQRQIRGQDVFIAVKQHYAIWRLSVLKSEICCARECVSELTMILNLEF